MGEMDVEWPMSLHDLARQQFGVVERRQVAGLAPSRSAARTELSRPHWIDLGLGVFRLRGAPVTDWQYSMAAVLQAGPGAVISHVGAAGFWGVPGMPKRPAHVTTMRNSNSRCAEGIVAHRARRLASDQVTALDGLPITRPERVPFDLANIGMSAQRLERAVDRMWSDRLVSGRSLRRVLKSLPRRGFRGTVVMREILDARGDDWIPPASGLESRAMKLLDEAGLRGFRRQVDLGHVEWVGRVDFVDMNAKVIIEVQSDRHHAALSSQRDDAERFAELEAAGFVVVTVWEDDLWHRPEAFLAATRAALFLNRE